MFQLKAQEHIINGFKQECFYAEYVTVLGKCHMLTDTTKGYLTAKDLKKLGIVADDFPYLESHFCQNSWVLEILNSDKRLKLPKDCPCTLRDNFVPNKFRTEYKDGSKMTEDLILNKLHILRRV